MSDEPLIPLHHFLAWLLVGAAVGGVPIGRWNDAPERTHAEVLAAFDRAIELAEATS